MHEGRVERLASNMIHTFKSAELQTVFLRRQGERTGEAIEKAWDATSKWSYALIEKNGDLIFFSLLYLIIGAVTITAVIRGGFPLQGDAPRVVFGAAVLGAFLELLRRIYDTAVKRLAIVDLFTSEMFNILRAFAAANIIGGFARLYDIADTEELAGPGTVTGSPPAAGLAHPAGDENYYDIFQSSSADLSLLDPSVVNDITAFYTFLKTARDATGAFRQWQDPRYSAAIKKEDIVTVVYLCFLMTVHGMLALERIVVSRNNWDLIEDISAGVLLQSFAILDSVVPRDDFRRPRIEQRREHCAQLQQKYGYEFGPVKPQLSSIRPATPLLP
jgi:hypothetical protein